MPPRGDDPGRGSEGDKRSRGFTIVELLIVVAILGTISGIGIAAYRSALEKARIARTMADVRVLEKDLAIHKLDTQRLPDSLAELGRGSRLDAWGRSFEYVRFCEPGETKGKGGGDGGGGGGDRDGRGRERNGGGDDDDDEDRGRGDRDGDRRRGDRGERGRGGDDRDERDRDERNARERDRDERDRDERDARERDRDERDRDDRDRDRNGNGGRRRVDDNDDCDSRQGKMRRDRMLKPLNSDYDLYSTGKDGESKPRLEKKESWDDIIRAVDGMYVGLASEF